MARRDHMHGTIDHADRVTITFSAQVVRLPAPDKPGKPPQQWFPCEGCGRVDSVDLAIVHYHCPDCAAKLDPPDLDAGPPHDAATAAGYYDP